jgi:VWFA-related protein
MGCKRGSTFVGLVLVCAFLFGPVVGARQSGRNVEAPAFEQSIEFNPGGVVKIDNQSGAVRVEIWSQNRVELSASKPQSSRVYWQSLISVNNSPGVIAITVKPAATLRVDLIARIPLQTRLDVKTNSGALEVSGEPAALTAETASGSVTVKLPANYDADLSLAAVNGAIRSELPVIVHGQFDAHLVQGKTGRGGQPIVIKSASGEINLVALLPTSQHPTVISDVDSPQVELIRDPTVRTPPRAPSDRSENEAENRAEESRRVNARRAPPEADAITLEAPLVNVNVTVSDGLGRPITDLKKEDFRIYEDGIEQTVTHFSPVTAPFDLVLLLDMSGSTESKKKVIKRAAQKFVELTNLEDRVAVYTFTRRLHLICPFTNNRLALRESIDKIETGGGTAFYDSLWRTLDELSKTRNRRKAVVVMTDGVDNSISRPDLYPSRYRFEELNGRVQESDVIIYPIYLDTEYQMVVKEKRELAENYAIAREQLTSLADESAGTLYKAAKVEDLEGVYQRVAAELRTVYSLAYSPLNAAHDGKWHEIQVKVSRESLKTRSRRGYVAK